MKLIRDFLIDADRWTHYPGGHAHVRTVHSSLEHSDLLHRKLLEEAAELITARHVASRVIEEAADVLEVVQTICILHGVKWDEVVAAADRKRESLGGYEIGTVWDV